MKSVKKECMRAFFIFVVQISAGLLVTNFIGMRWSFKDFITNYVFIIFWSSYMICILGIEISKKVILKKEVFNFHKKK